MSTLRPAATTLGLALLAAAFVSHADDAAPSATTVDTTATPAKPQPLWEVGLAGGIGSFSDYPASDRYRVRAIPLPYFIYRGQFLRADDEGTRVRAKFSPSVELEFSGGGSLSAQSGSSGPRAGMPDLDYLFELGPSLKITAAQPTRTSRVIIDLPVRAVFSTDLHSRLDWRGVVFAPDIGLEERALFGSNWGGRIGLATEFASGRTQDYFYQVDPQYARAGRPAYDAHGGYLGSALEVAVYRPLTPNFRIYAYGRFNLYSAAENDDSPLFKADTGFGAILGFAWSIWQSKETVAPSNRSFSDNSGAVR